MYSVNITINENQLRFTVGDTVSGMAQVTLPVTVALTDVTVSFHCLGQVKWAEYPGSPKHANDHTRFGKQYYHNEVLQSFQPISQHTDEFKRTLIIPFAFIIPKDKNLPSTMMSTFGFVKYFVRLTIKHPESGKIIRKFFKEIIVESPFDKDLMITVVGAAEKTVLLHKGKVTMHASIARKGFAVGDTVLVHLSVDNKTNTKVVPEISLKQVQVFMCDHSHKTVLTTLNDKPVVGTKVSPHTKVEELLPVSIPLNEALSMKCSLITLKYYVHVTLDIPHSFDLNINLPIVVTSEKVISALRKGNEHAELVCLSDQIDSTFV